MNQNIRSKERNISFIPGTGVYTNAPEKFPKAVIETTQHSSKQVYENIHPKLSHHGKRLSRQSEFGKERIVNQYGNVISDSESFTAQRKEEELFEYSEIGEHRG